MTAAEQLADARRKLGLSLAETATRTKVDVERLTAIEGVDLRGLPPLVYLKGFVRAYAAEVGLDADTIADRYVSELPDPGALASSALSSGVYIMPTIEESLAAFESEAPDGDAVVPPNASRVIVTAPDDFATEVAQAQMSAAHEPAVVRATRPPLTQASRYRTSPAIVLLALASVLAGIGGFLLSANMDGRGGGRSADSDSASAAESSRGSAVAKATSESPAPAPPAPGGATTGPPPASVHAPDQSAPVAPPVTRPPATGPSDVNASRATPALAPRQRRAARPSPETQNQNAVASSDSISNSSNKTVGTERSVARRNTEPTRGESAVADSSVPSAMILVPGFAAEPGTTTTVGTADAADDVTGAWSVTSHVEAATVDAYQNLMLGFRLQLKQRGNRVVGSGYKVTENGAALPARRRTPINVEGTLDGTRLALDFTERGARRASAGRFVLDLSDDGSFRGRFKSDAAQSSGVTVAVRESSARD